jgi:hypothetical protein
LVFTNATQYLAGAPEYNFARQSLDYKVSAPHLMSNGELFKGNYELLIRDDVARCIYGFGRGELDAQVSVLGQDPNVANLLLTGVTQTNGWLRFSASGFTHSTPVIRTVIRQKPVQTRAGVQKAISSSQLAKMTRLKRSKSSKVTLKVSRKSKRICRVQSGMVRTLRKGSCQVAVTVTTGKKKSTRTVIVTVR